MGRRYFHGWNEVGATFVMALWSFGLGFYGLTVYVAALQQLHGWSASAVSAPVTVYYVAGALLTATIGGVYERLGPRVVVAELAPTHDVKPPRRTRRALCIV